MELWQIFLIVFAVISVVNFFMYGIDKRKAKKGKWRISEKALLLTSFFGGAVGGFKFPEIPAYMLHCSRANRQSDKHKK